MEGVQYTTARLTARPPPPVINVSGYVGLPCTSHALETHMNKIGVKTDCQIIAQTVQLLEVSP